MKIRLFFAIFALAEPRWHAWGPIDQYKINGFQ